MRARIILSSMLICLYGAKTVVALSDACSTAVCDNHRECSFPNIPIYIGDNEDCCQKKLVCTCQGTDDKLSSSSSPTQQLERLRKLYTNCTLVDGNLEIVSIKLPPGEEILHFTEHIEEVKGYVLISRVHAKYIDLSSLRLIRGFDLYQPTTTLAVCNFAPNATLTKYSMHVQDNTADSRGVALEGILMPHLTEISKGSVAFIRNSKLCHVGDIEWEAEIFQYGTDQTFSIDHAPDNCEACHPSCNETRLQRPRLTCWKGNDSSMCQLFTRLSCTTDCGVRRCDSYGHCCDSQCAAGCDTSGEPRRCHACRKVNHDGKCVESCPRGKYVDPNKPSEVTEAAVTYQYARYCLKDCPSHVPQYDEYCVRFCPTKYFDYDHNTCKACENGKCDHVCYGLDTPYGELQQDTYINARNIRHFNKNCTIIEGSLVFIGLSFEDDSFCHVPGISNLTMLDVFENVREITGSLVVDSWPEKNLCVFKNLRRIRGKTLRLGEFALQVLTSESTLRELCLNSLDRIDRGNVYVGENAMLGYAKSVAWKRQIFSTKNQKAVIKKNLKMSGPCNVQCSAANGCWGDGADQCVKCANFTDLTGADGSFAPAWRLDPDSGLNVPGNNRTTCVPECDITKGVFTSRNKLCLPCHPECWTCDGPTAFNCTGVEGCRNVELDGKCMARCPESHFSHSNRTCLPCSRSCVDGGCNGPEDNYGLSGCDKCHLTNVTGEFTFTGKECTYCRQEEICALGCFTTNRSSNLYKCLQPPGSAAGPIAGGVIGGVLAVAVVVLFLYCRRNQAKLNRMSKVIGDTLVGDVQHQQDETIPLTPSGAAPNQAQLRIVKDNELVMGKLLGSGAFGEVCKAIWTPISFQGEKVKIAVAVKTLKTPEDMTHAANNEIMDEAYIMASVDCPYLVRLLGVCMRSRVSLITQLMPLGSLLDHLRDPQHKDQVRSRQMLTWCVQIAKGMQYLEEEKHLVHRDLAARNVLVRTPNHVKITDFGLARMLDVREDYYHAEGGKLPIKWLALECITERTFSHLSDVWAFGITCWEIFTFGARPYEGVRAVEMLSLLEKGDRLPQPAVATIDIYMLLIKCWMVDRLCRPTFCELVAEFSRMVRDPQRYLVLKNDDMASTATTPMLSPTPMDEANFFRQLLDEEKQGNGDLMIADEPDQYLLCSAAHSQPPVYANDLPATTTMLTTNGVHGNNGRVPTVNHHPLPPPQTAHDHRLFSRNTPSARIDSFPSDLAVTPPAHGDDVFDLSLRSAASLHAVAGSKAEPYGGDFAGGLGGTRGAAAASTSARKNSEDTRYTEDPTRKRNNSVSLFSAAPPQPNDLYDADDYLLPMTSEFTPSAADLTDPKQTFEPEPQPPTSSSLANHAYVESGALSPPTEHASSPADYVNATRGGDPVFFVNEEYMTADSGIGCDDTQSLLSRHPRNLSAQSSNGGGGGGGGEASSREGDDSPPTFSGCTVLENPEYMLLNDKGEGAVAT